MHDSNLECSSKTITSEIDQLSNFDRLRVVEIEFSPDGLKTQFTRIKMIFKHLSPNITELRLTWLPCIDINLLSMIAARFTALETLDLTCAERLDEECCWLCYEESLSRTVHSPVPDVCYSTEQLPVIVPG